MTGIFVVKKRDKRFMQEDYFIMGERIWFPAFDEFF